MIVAKDAEGQRIYASREIDYKECFCPACEERLKHKNKGKVKRPYFSHLAKSDCEYGKGDYKSEWHIRMQEYFPEEAREYLFKDEETGEKHIADVYLKEVNTVIEFQKSRISQEEFNSRTFFHQKNGRRIVWIFNESVDSEKPNYGRFRATYEEKSNKSPNDILNYHYQVRTYRWLRNPRRMLSSVPDNLLQSGEYSVCVYTGTEGDLFHRIIGETQGFEEVVFSIHDIAIKEKMDVEEFFKPELVWQNEDPWKEEFIWRKMYFLYAEGYIKKQQSQMQINNLYTPFSNNRPPFCNRRKQRRRF